MTGDDEENVLARPPEGAEAIHADDGHLLGWLAPSALPDRWRAWTAVDGRFITSCLQRDAAVRMLSAHHEATR